MCCRRRHGKIDRLQLILLPPCLFFAGVLLYNVFRFVSPPAFAVEGVETVEVLEVVGKLSPLRANGLLCAQAESIEGGGSSRLVIARPAVDGPFLLVRGNVLHGFLVEKVGLDNMLHLKIDTSKIAVEVNGEPVEAILFGPRKETAPLRVANVTVGPEEDVISILYANQTIQPAATGQSSAGNFTGDNGMLVKCGVGVGRGGPANLGEQFELQFTLDELSSAWIEMPKSVRLASTAVGAENWDIGLLIPIDKRPAQIRMFDEVVATVD